MPVRKPLASHAVGQHCSNAGKIGLADCLCVAEHPSCPFRLIIVIHPARLTGKAEESVHVILINGIGHGDGAIIGLLAAAPPLHELPARSIKRRQVGEELSNIGFGRHGFWHELFFSANLISQRCTAAKNGFAGLGGFKILDF